MLKIIHISLFNIAPIPGQTTSFYNPQLYHWRPPPKSDHSIVTVILRCPIGLNGLFKWHLNEALLSHPVQCTILEKALREYFTESDNNTVSPGTLWAAHKAAMRGKIIQISSQLKRERGAEIQKLTEEFLLVSKHHKSNPTPDNLSWLDEAQIQLNLALTTAGEKH